MPQKIVTDEELVALETEFRDSIYFKYEDSKAMRKARFHNSINYLLFEQGLSDGEIAEQVESDYSDQGIDFFHVTEDDLPKVWVVQVKDHENFTKSNQREAVVKMTTEIDDLLTRQRVGPSWPDVRKERYYQLKKIREGSFQIKYVLILTGSAEADLDQDEDFPESAFNGDTSTLLVIDRKKICELVQHSDNPRELDAELQISFSEAGVQEAKDGRPKYLFGLISIFDYVSATKKLGTELFALNPRLFLSANAGPNRGMLTTLEDPAGRKVFHLLNNGITAVCKKLDVSLKGSSGSAKVQGLLVVNGCQTTETLWHWTRDPDAMKQAKDVSVMVRIIESGKDEELSRRISQTTNSQSAIVSSDLVANDDIQKRLKSALLDSAQKPTFYENRRGEWRKLSAAKKLEFRIPDGEFLSSGVQYRKMTLREMAQVLQAVLGHPDQAKEGITSLFKVGSKRYPEIFSSSWTEPVQVQLVADLFRFISNKNNWLKVNPTSEENEMASLGRFYISYLVYESWRGGGRPRFPKDGGSSSELFDAELSEQKLVNLKDEATKLANLANYSLVRTLSNNSGIIDDKRALLRVGSNKILIQSTFEDVLAVFYE
jgi:hypothetical protein